MHRASLAALLLLLAALAGCTGQRSLPYTAEPDLRGVELQIAPLDARVIAGSWKQFSVNYRDFDGNWQTPEGEKWSCSAGTINDEGAFTAPAEPGPVIITCRWRGLARSTSIEVIPNDIPIRLDIIPATLEVQAGSSFPLTLRIQSAGNVDIELPASWEADIGRIDLVNDYEAPRRAIHEPNDYRSAIDEWETRVYYTAPRDCGREHIRARLRTGEQAEANYDIVPAAPAYIVINPRRANVAPNDTQVFSAIPYDRFGNRIAGNVVWTASDGTIDQNGVYRAPLSGGASIVSALFGGISETATVNNAALGDPVRIEIRPNSGSLRIGQTLVFTAKGIDEYGNQVELRSPAWSTDNGEINNFGMYYSGNAAIGPARIRVQDSGVVAEVVITLIY